MFKRGSLNEAIADRFDVRGRESLDRIDLATDEVQASVQRAADAAETAALVIAFVALAIGATIVIRNLSR